MIDQLPKQGGGQLPPFKGGIDPPPPAPMHNNHKCDAGNVRQPRHCTIAPRHPLMFGA